VENSGHMILPVIPPPPPPPPLLLSAFSHAVVFRFWFEMKIKRLKTVELKIPPN